MKKNFKKRIHFILIFLFFVAFLLIARLYIVQIINGEEFSHQADRQYVRPNQNLYDRGSIFLKDKDGLRISGAMIKSGFTIAINPKILQDPEGVYEKLNAIIPVNQETFFLRSGKKDDPYEEIAKQVDAELANRVDELDIIGLDIFKEQWRHYPGKSLGAQTLGFVGYDGDTLSGRYGLERYYDDLLVIEDNNLYVNFFAEIFGNVQQTLSSDNTKREGSLITSLEPSVQLFLENILAEINTEWESKQTVGIIINPSNGEIYAIGIYPTFDINLFSKEEDPSVFSNPIVENVYELGSIMKPLTMAAGLDSGVITADTTYVDKGSIKLDGYVISNFDKKGRGRISMQGVLSESLNTGAVFVAGEMGNETFREYMLAYGLGEETGIDLPNESAGLVANLYSPRDVEYATASFGQGIAVTPISMVRALSSLANKGVLITPHLVKEIIYKSGLSKTMSWSDGEAVLKPETAEEITRMLVHVVDNALLGGTVKIPQYSIAAKTGTAQIAKMRDRGYYDDRFLHSFFGYFPAYDPKFLIFLYTLEPIGAKYASQTLTQPFIDMVKFLINYYEIPPDR